MATNLIATATDLKAYFPANFALSIDVVQPYLRRAQDGPLRDAVGAALLTQLRTGVHASDDVAELRELARRVEANYALSYLLSTGAIQLSNLGLTEYAGDNQKPVPAAKVQMLRDDLEAAGGEAVEALLEWLEENRTLVPAWVSSDACTWQVGQFVATAREFQEHVNIERSRRRFQQLRPALRQAEEMGLRPVLGRPLLRAIKAELAAGAPSEASTELLDDYIRPALCHLAAGIEAKDEDRQANGAAYLEELRLFLVAHAADYPLFVVPTTAVQFSNPEDSCLCFF